MDPTDQPGPLKSLRRKLVKACTRAIVKPYRRGRPATKNVAIVIPMSTRPDLTPEERISLRQLLAHLGPHDKYFITAEGMEFTAAGVRNKWFPRRFFGSVAAHGKLLFSRSFYRAFEDYEFVFFYHLDSLVFSDQLDEWCRTDIDYIGPPWIRCADSPWVDRPRVGNGGFTLLRVEAALRALTGQYLDKPSQLWFDTFTFRSPRWLIRATERVERAFPRFWPAARLMREWREMEDPGANNRNSDIFWSDLAELHAPGFKVASVEEGLRFAFEVSPRTCLEMNGGEMPFGCHAWARYDRAFWEPHLVPADALPEPREAPAPVVEMYGRAAVRSA